MSTESMILLLKENSQNLLYFVLKGSRGNSETSSFFVDGWQINQTKFSSLTMVSLVTFIVVQIEVNALLITLVPF